MLNLSFKQTRIKPCFITEKCQNVQCRWYLTKLSNEYRWSLLKSKEQSHHANHTMLFDFLFYNDTVKTNSLYMHVQKIRQMK